MRKVPALIVLVVLALWSSPVTPTAQRGPTISSDLRAARAKGERVRVIVQGGDVKAQGLAVGRGAKVSGFFKRQRLQRQAQVTKSA